MIFVANLTIGVFIFSYKPNFDNDKNVISNFLFYVIFKQYFIYISSSIFVF